MRRMTEYSWAHVTDDWIWSHVFISTHHGSHDIHETRHRWHEYSWVGLHVNDGMNIHEYTSQVTWIFMSRPTRHRWHECSWVYITGDMSIRHGWHDYSWVHVTGDMVIHECTWWHDYSWVHITGDVIIHRYMSRVTWIIMSTRHGWHE